MGNECREWLNDCLRRFPLLLEKPLNLESPNNQGPWLLGHMCWGGQRGSKKKCTLYVQRPYPRGGQFEFDPKKAGDFR